MSRESEEAVPCKVITKTGKVLQSPIKTGAKLRKNDRNLTFTSEKTYSLD